MQINAAILMSLLGLDSISHAACGKQQAYLCHMNMHMFVVMYVCCWGQNVDRNPDKRTVNRWHFHNQLTLSAALTIATEHRSLVYS